MEGSTHDIVVMPGQYTQAGSLIEVPQSQCLIITRRQDPRILCGIGVKLNCTDVIKMTQQGEKTSAQFVIPNLDFVIITSTNNKRIGFVKVDTSYGSIVLFEAIDDGTNSVIPTVIELRKEYI